MVDYKEVLLALVPVELRTQHLCGFLCELSLLHTSLSTYAPARLAAAALLLARLTHRQSKERPFPGMPVSGKVLTQEEAVGRKSPSSVCPGYFFRDEIQHSS